MRNERNAAGREGQKESEGDRGEREREREGEQGGGSKAKENGGGSEERERKNAPFRERRGAAGKAGSIRAAFELSVAQYLEPFSRN